MLPVPAQDGSGRVRHLRYLRGCPGRKSPTATPCYRPPMTRRTTAAAVLALALAVVLVTWAAGGQEFPMLGADSIMTTGGELNMNTLATVGVFMLRATVCPDGWTAPVEALPALPAGFAWCEPSP